MKKKLLTLLAIGIIPNILSAHSINAGTIELKGDVSLGYTSQEINNGSKTDIKGSGLSLMGLYYVIPNLGVGLHWDYSFTDNNNQEYTESIIGPSIAYNIPIAPKMSVQPFGYIAYVRGETTTSTDFDGTEWGVGTRINYFINNHIAINAGIEYTSQDVDYERGAGDFKEKGFASEVGLSVYF